MRICFTPSWISICCRGHSWILFLFLYFVCVFVCLFILGGVVSKKFYKNMHNEQQENMYILQVFVEIHSRLLFPCLPFISAKNVTNETDMTLKE